MRKYKIESKQDDDGDDDNHMNAHIVDLQSFNREKDFQDYILSFLNDVETPVSTLIIQCDPIPNNDQKDEMYNHYLHAQYLNVMV